MYLNCFLPKVSNFLKIFENFEKTSFFFSFLNFFSSFLSFGPGVLLVLLVKNDETIIIIEDVQSRF